MGACNPEAAECSSGLRCQRVQQADPAPCLQATTVLTCHFCTYRATGLTHLYTIEANYNTARLLNCIADCKEKCAFPACQPSTRTQRPGAFGTAEFQAVGRALLVAVLDLNGANPCSRLPNTAFRDAQGVRKWILSASNSTVKTDARSHRMTV